MSKIITTHLTLGTPVEQVWRTLTTLDDYHHWNPFITSAAGVLEVGERLDITVQPPGARPMRFKPWVTAIESHRYIEWLGRLGVPGVFDGRHSFTLTPLSGGRTLMQQSETFSGALVPFSGSVLTRTHEGFTSMNAALEQETTRTKEGSSSERVAPRSSDRRQVPGM
jgi:hypothetical protein